MKETMQSQDLAIALAQFTGTDHYHRHPYGGLYTDGVAYFAKHAGGGAHWLLNIIFTQPEILEQAQSFAVITLEVHSNETANITVTDGNEHVAYTRQIGYTDCPAGLWKFFFTDNVLMLPSEY